MAMEKIRRDIPAIHPGILLKEMYLHPLGITLTRLAGNIRVARKTVSQLVNGHVGINVEMAMLLSKSFETTPELWLNLQRTYDLWYADGNERFNAVRSLRKINDEKLISVPK